MIVANIRFDDKGTQKSEPKREQKKKNWKSKWILGTNPSKQNKMLKAGIEMSFLL